MAKVRVRMLVLWMPACGRQANGLRNPNLKTIFMIRE